MRFKAHLRNVAFEAALVLGVAAPALAQRPAPLTDRQKTFAGLIGVPGVPALPNQEAFSELSSDALLKLSFGQWPLPGIDYDPEIVRSAPLITDTQFDRAADTFHARTHIHGGFKEMAPIIFSADYLDKERAAFGPILIESSIMPVDTAVGANTGISIEAHEVAHALHDRRLALTQLLGLFEPLQNIGQSRMSGHGPVLEALLQKGESPEETELRHQHLQAAINNPAPNADDSIALEYPLFYTEIRSYLLEAMVAPVAAHVWTRLPQNRGELWAAFANIIGETPQGDNPVSRFRATPEGVAATRDFPLILDGPAAQNGRTWLQRGYDAIKPAQKAEYFTQVLPEIYGELLEDLGDPQGMAKMGLAPSPLHAFAFADHLIDSGKGTPLWTAAEWERRAQQVEPIAFERLCELALVHRQPLALTALLHTEDIVPGHVLSDRTKRWLLLKADEIAGWDPAGSEGRLNAQQSVQALEVSTLPLAPSFIPKPAPSIFALPSWPQGVAQDFERPLPSGKGARHEEVAIRFEKIAFSFGKATIPTSCV